MILAACLLSFLCVYIKRYEVKVFKMISCTFLNICVFSIILVDGNSNLDHQ